MKNYLIENLGQPEKHEKRGIQCLIGLGLIFILVVSLSVSRFALAAEGLTNSSVEPPSAFMKLSLDDALALFLKQNLQILIAKYGIDSAKGKTITAGLFPNPTFSINTLTAYTQKCDLLRCGGVMPVVSQLFEVAGKRGFRVESAGYGTKSSEAMFENTVRQLRIAVKDAYYRVQVGREHLAVDKKTYDRITRHLKGKTTQPISGMEERDKIRFHISSVKAQAQVIHDIQDIDAATADLRVLVGLSPMTELELTTALQYRRVDPHGPQLRRLAESRPDIHAKRLLFSRRRAELKLANSIMVPDVTVDLGYLIQGPMGPDNQQQWTFNVGIPLPIFDQNQGGIMVANADLLAARADLQKTLNELHIEVDKAYRRMIQSRRLVEVYREGVLEEAQLLFNSAEEAYAKEKGLFLDLVDAGQIASDLEESYLEALFSYQRDVLLLESAVGQDLH